MARADRRRVGREAGQHRAGSKTGRRPAARISTRAAYESSPATTRATINRVRDVAEDWYADPLPGRLSKLAAKHKTTLSSVERYLPTRKTPSGRLELAPPGQVTLYGGPIPALVDVDGRPTVVRITPANEAQRRDIRSHTKGAFQVVNDDGDALLDRLGGRVVEDAETGQRYRLWEDADALRDAADTGEVELADLRYGGGHRSDLDALLAEEDELA